MEMADRFLPSGPAMVLASFKSGLYWVRDPLSRPEINHLLLYQGGSEIRPFKIRTFWQSDLKWSGFSYGYSPNHLKSGHFVRISNGF